MTGFEPEERVGRSIGVFLVSPHFHVQRCERISWRRQPDARRSHASPRRLRYHDNTFAVVILTAHASVVTAPGRPSVAAVYAVMRDSLASAHFALIATSHILRPWPWAEANWQEFLNFRSRGDLTCVD
jgi:hypothetical protein